MNIEIKTFDNLLAFIENTNLKQQQIETLIQKTINIFILLPIDKEFSKQKLITNLKEFWSEWGNKPIAERPLFLDIDF